MKRYSFLAQIMIGILLFGGLHLSSCRSSSYLEPDNEAQSNETLREKARQLVADYKEMLSSHKNSNKGSYRPLD